VSVVAAAARTRDLTPGAIPGQASAPDLALRATPARASHEGNDELARPGAHPLDIRLTWETTLTPRRVSCIPPLDCATLLRQWSRRNQSLRVFQCAPLPYCPPGWPWRSSPALPTNRPRPRPPIWLRLKPVLRRRHIRLSTSAPWAGPPAWPQPSMPLVSCRETHRTVVPLTAVFVPLHAG
jgi:hypothetical protein